ncbi:MAG: phosphoglycerate dehydrogenase [Planctomycetota bacterium]|nr:MAG: phosphoglycerate dehydrogenase [Planctomycetota bacterium]
MIKILVADPLAEAGLQKIKDLDGVEADVKTGLGEDELAAIVGEYDGMIVRSGVKVTAKVLENPGKLRVVARAGVGVDNIDLEAATQAGILVMNTPDANTISTAEQTMSLMLAMSRHVAKGDAHVRAKEWNRKAFMGTQLAGKTLGIIGLGRVGQAVAQRAAAFDMKIVAYDPFYSGETALDGLVTLLGSRDEVFAQSDYLTMHTKLTDDTKEMINKENIAKMKDGVRIVNSSRGGVINDTDLAEALKSGKVAAAAIDVYVKEPPPPDHPLIDAPNTVLAPHLGASTKEAQLAVTLDAVDGLMNYLLHDEIRQAVNVTGLPAQMSDRDKAYMDLAYRMGAIMSRLGSGVIESVSVTTHGKSLESLGSPLQRQILVALLSPHFTTRLNLINVDAFANERGIKVEHTADLAASAITDAVTLRITTKEGPHEIVGEVFIDGRPRIMAIDGYQMNLEPEGEMVMILNDDQPGVIGLVGSIFGNHNINIADCMLSRKKKTALMALKIDGEIPSKVMDELMSHKPPISKVLPVTLPPIKS